MIDKIAVGDLVTLKDDVGGMVSYGVVVSTKQSEAEDENIEEHDLHFPLFLVLWSDETISINGNAVWMFSSEIRKVDCVKLSNNSKSKKTKKE
jgi:hypothetical protein